MWRIVKTTKNLSHLDAFRNFIVKSYGIGLGFLHHARPPIKAYSRLVERRPALLRDIIEAGGSETQYTADHSCTTAVPSLCSSCHMCALLSLYDTLRITSETLVLCKRQLPISLDPFCIPCLVGNDTACQETRKNVKENAEKNAEKKCQREWQ